MVKVKKYKKGVSAFISSEKGQRFFNFAYSIGAAIVIWGALFKILHLPGGNTLLSIGMGTEVLMFVLTAFDRPPREYNWEEVFPALRKKEQEIEDKSGEGEVLDDESGEGTIIEGFEDEDTVQGRQHGGGGNYGSGTIVIGGGYAGPAAGGNYAPTGEMPASVPVGGSQSAGAQVASAPIAAPTDFASATQLYIDQVTSIAEELKRMQDSTQALNNVSETLLKSYEAISEHSEEIKESSTGYADQIQTLNRNIAGLNTIYEIQLKSVSSQIDAIDRVNKGIKDIRDMFEKSAEQSTRYCEETEKMARYMQQLNKVYEKMITAMTINMYRPTMMPGAAPEEALDNGDEKDSNA